MEISGSVRDKQTEENCIRSFYASTNITGINNR
jgi:hypothetical protein